MLNLTSTSIVAIFDNRQDLRKAVETLKIQGFPEADISVLLQDKDAAPSLAHERNTKAPEGAATGWLSGAVIGCALGWFSGTGDIGIPGLALFVSAGPIMSAMGGMGLGGTLGGLAGGLIGLGFPEYEARRYAASIKKGGMIVSVHISDKRTIPRVRALFKVCGGRDISRILERPSRNKKRVESVQATPETIDPESYYRDTDNLL